MIRKLIAVFIGLGLIACSGVGQSKDALSVGVSPSLLAEKPQEWSMSYAANAEVKAFIERMVSLHDYDRSQLEQAFSHIKQRPKVIEKSNNQPEVITPFYQYKKRFLSQSRIAAGVNFAKENTYWLKKAESEFGVDSKVIVALLGVETYYGKITGSKDVFTSLTTLAFDYPRRKAYFQSELEAYLLLVRSNGWDIGETKGSYSGAMGMAQFMPSNYQRLAVDYDQDGKVDLWGSNADAIGSIANYLKHHGWQAGQPWGVMARVMDPNKVRKYINHGRSPSKSAEVWSSLGVLPIQSSVVEKSGLIALRTQKEVVSYWLAYENFFTIMDYNPSRRYAMSVLELAASI